MRRFAIAFIAAMLVMGVLDALWLGVLTKDFYRIHIGHLMADTVQPAAAIGFYVLYVTGVVVFAVLPSMTATSAWRAAGLGALFGLVAYATYDLTNLATLRGWPVVVAVVDMAWGSFISAAAAAGSHHVTARFTR